MTIDSMLSQPGTRRAVKALFGLSALEHDYDFVTTIEVSIWQGYGWVSAADAVARWCLNPGKPRTGILKLEAKSSMIFASE